MIAYSLFIILYFGVIRYAYSKDRREWWDLTQEEQVELVDKYLPEGEYTDEVSEGTFPDGWFDLEDWEKSAILDKNLDDYYKDEANEKSDFTDVSKSHEGAEYQGGRRCVIV